MSAALLALIVWLGVFRPGLPVVLDSDTLYLDDLWLSLSQGAGFGLWLSPPAPAFFPDLLLMGLLSIVPDLAMRHALFGLTLLLLLAISVAWLARQRQELEWGPALGCGLAGSLLAGLALILAPSYQDILKPGQHGGALLASLWLFALAPGQQGSAGLLKKLGACALTAMMTFSDRLFLVWGLIPLLLSQALSWRAGASDEWKSWLAWLAGGVLLGEAGISSLHGPGLPLIMAAEPLKSWQPMPTLLSAQLRQLVDLARGAGPAVLISVAWLVWRARSFFGSGRAFSHAGSATLPRFVWMSAACGALAALGLEGFSFRHSYPFFLLPLLTLPLDLPRSWSLRLPLIAACLLLPLELWKGWRQSQLKPWSWAYPQEAAMLDKVLMEDGRLNLGMAHYGQARRLRLLARSKPVLIPIKAEPGSTELQTYDWMVDASIFKSLELKRADYVLMDGLDPGLVAGAFGRPMRVFKQGAHELWVYR